MIDRDELFALVVVGSLKDVSFLTDVLPLYVFPHDECAIGEWVLAGFSLGGHATWLALRYEAALSMGPSLGREREGWDWFPHNPPEMYDGMQRPYTTPVPSAVPSKLNHIN
ncbi:hypothetical protein EDB85DRAFT_2157385 [Lactarius pseudohatsudake]|nr:hypothetical protein EDB85DRAFT_2157385 [Lactarius pseudohatsudake]